LGAVCERFPFTARYLKTREATMNTGRRDDSKAPSNQLSLNRRPELSILFIDPDVASAERLVRSLQGRYAFAVVPTARQAQAAINARTPDLIVMELDLPDARGLELLLSLHNSPTMRHILILVLTKRQGVADKIAAFQAGADDYLVKPVDAEQFETHVLLVSRFRKIIGR
jgi:PleD family two-component response regulator